MTSAPAPVESSYLDINGPCPLIAIANVLLLRGRVSLPLGVGEVGQERLVALVAEALLDANPLDRPGLTDEYRANLQHNLSDAIHQLPKLCTGVDVNVRFHDIRAFEFTNEIAVFDLLDIPLVHGWLVDPQDATTAAALGQHSYNEVVMALVTTLGREATPRQLTPTVSMAKSTDSGRLGCDVAGQSSSSPAATPAAGGAAAAGAAVATGSGGTINAGALAAALQSLHVSTAQGADSPALSGAPTAAGSAMSDATRGQINHMLSDLIRNAFASDTLSSSTLTAASSSEPGSRPGALAGAGGGEPAAAAAAGAGGPPPAALERVAEAAAEVTVDDSGGEATSATGQYVQLLLEVEEPGEEVAAAGERPEGPVSVSLLVRPPRLLSPFESLDGSLAPSLSAGLSTRGAELELDGSKEGPATLPAAAAAGVAASAESNGTCTSASAAQQQRQQRQGQEQEQQQQQTPAAPAPAGCAGLSPASSADMRKALAMQAFLEGHPSQLTYHGLLSLHEGLRDGQLAVFFRNNHFSTLHARGGKLYLLVTDQGYQFEPDVVWEELNSVDGDTALVDAAFQPFVPHNTVAEASGVARGSTAAAAAAAEWDAVAAAAAACGDHSMDADLALAMQLQAEEEERMRAEAAARRETAARQEAETRRREAGRAAPAAGRTGHSQLLPSQRPQQQSLGGKGKKKSSECMLM